MNKIKYPDPPFPAIDDETYRLRPGRDYVDEIYDDKTGIILHHTVGGSAKSTFDWWKKKDSRVATSYVIDKDGTVYEFFPDNRWAWHIGQTSNDNERRTIGIEIVSEGGLVKKEGEFLKYYNPKTKRGYRHNDKVVDLEETWRGFRYFDAYEKEQIASLICLVPYLIDKYDMKRKMPEDLWTYRESLKEHEGVISHAQIRPDKTDVHPRFPIGEFAKWCKIDLI